MGEPLGAQLSHRPPGSAPGRCAGFRPALGALDYFFFFFGAGLTHQYLAQLFRAGEKIS